MGQYLSPSSLAHNTKCAIVFYPEDDGGFFLAALRGQLTQLENVWIWEGSAQQVSDIVQIWTQHNIMSEMAWDRVDCEAVPYLTGEETMNVNVNLSSNCGCGCGGCGGGSGAGCGGQVNQNLDPTQAYPLAPLPTDEIPEEDVSVWKCDATHQLWADYYQFFVELQATASTVVVGITTLTGIAVGFAVLTGGISFAVTLLANLAVGGVAAAAAYARDWLEEHKEEFICQIYNSVSPSQAYDNARAYVQANKNTPFGAVVGFFVGNMLLATVDDTDWNLLFDPGSMTIHSSNTGAVCDCGAPELPPPIDPEDPLPELPLPITVIDCEAIGGWVKGNHASAADPVPTSLLLDNGVPCTDAPTISNHEGRDIIVVGGSETASVGFSFTAPYTGKITLLTYVDSNFAHGLTMEVRGVASGPLLSTQTVPKGTKLTWHSVTFDHVFSEGSDYFVTWFRGGERLWALSSGSFDAA